MSTAAMTGQKLYGLFEVDGGDTVLYSRPEGGGQAWGPRTGHNFFEAAPILNAEELRRVVDDFRRSGAPAKSVAFTCLYEDGPEHVRMLMARMREDSDMSHVKSTLIHIRKA